MAATKKKTARKQNRRSWSDGELKQLKDGAKKKTKAGVMAKAFKRTPGAVRQKAFSMGLSLDSR